MYIGNDNLDIIRCVVCKKCIRELGCPAIVLSNDKVMIEPSLCFGCGLCAKICPTGAIVREVKENDK